MAPLFTGDCVYIMQGDMVKAAQEAGKVPYKFVKRLVPDELLIFRVEKLWKDERLAATSGTET